MAYNFPFVCFTESYLHTSSCTVEGLRDKEKRMGRNEIRIKKNEKGKKVRGQG